MKKLLLIGLGCLIFAGIGSLSEAQAGVQVSINLGGSRPHYSHYYGPPRAYYYDPCPPVVSYCRPVVIYSRPPAYYYAPRHHQVYYQPYACR
jgi:hypothetical protein